MIPPLLLGVRPGHTVLDMCAAPGSKTAQLIELLHRDSNDNFVLRSDGTFKSNSDLDGLVVANDVDNKRCYMLVHQSKRLHSPGVVIVNHDASQMPNMYRTDGDGQRKLLKFDRILADVPCTGDGTVRKNYDVWKKWNVANGNNFHSLQLKIAKRGLEMLAVGGQLAYSTCSLNPIEDEAVICELLRWGNGALELVDASKLAPSLVCKPGLASWTVMSREKEVFNSYSEVPDKLQSQIKESLFPPANADELNVKYCVRVLPHYQNTGGFFIAILKKTALVPGEKKEVDNKEEVEKEAEAKKTDDKPMFNMVQKKKRNAFLGHKEDPFYFIDKDDEEWHLLR